MANFDPLVAEIVSLVWGTPGNFNGLCVLAALLHGTLVVGVSQTAALNRGRHLYSAGRPSRWALAHILVLRIKRTTISISCQVLKRWAERTMGRDVASVEMRLYIGRSDVTAFCGHNTISTLWGNTACCVKLSGEDLSRYSNNTESVGLRKCPCYHYLRRLCHNNKHSLPHMMAEKQLAWIWYEEIMLLSPYG